MSFKTDFSSVADTSLMDGSVWLLESAFDASPFVDGSGSAAGSRFALAFVAVPFDFVVDTDLFASASCASNSFRALSMFCIKH